MSKRKTRPDRTVESRAEHPIAKRFAREMRKAMGERKYSQREVASMLGCQQSYISRYVNGHTIPMLDRAQKLSEILACEALLALAKEWASRTCDVCGIDFYTNNLQMRQRFCSTNCKGIAHRNARKKRDELSQKFARERLKVHQRLVRAFCEDCTAGEGICRDGNCALRPVSPMPFIPMHGMLHGSYKHRVDKRAEVA